MKRSLMYCLLFLLLLWPLAASFTESAGESAWNWDIRGNYEGEFKSIQSPNCPETIERKFTTKIEQNMQVGSEVWGSIFSPSGNPVGTFKAQIKPYDKRRCRIVEGNAVIQGQSVRFEGWIIRESVNILSINGKYWRDNISCSGKITLKRLY